MRALFLILHLGWISIFATTWAYPSIDSTGEIGNDVFVMKDKNSNSTTIGCRSDLLLKPGEFLFHPNGTAFVLDTNKILKPSEYITVDGNLCIIEYENDKTTESPLSHLTEWYYKPIEFTFPPYDFGASEMGGDKPDKYMEDYDYGNITIKSDPTRESLIYVGQVGASISILSLFLHLLMFARMPSRRNLQGYCLASLSIAFVMGYFFFLFGQIPSISHAFCVVAASFKYFFFLSAFFWMSMINYDVWRCLRLAINHNLAPSNSGRKSRFICYSIIAWGFPFCLIITTLTDGFSSEKNSFKPFFGRYNICWFTNTTAKNMYFGVPVGMMLALNCKLFIRIIVMIIKYTTRDASDLKRTAVQNVALYARIAVVMLIIWSIDLAATVSDQKILWVIFDTLNSLQGFFIFMFYSFTRVLNFLKDKGKLTSADSAMISIIENSSTRSVSESDIIE